MNNSITQRKEKLKKFSHILAGVLILLHAFEKHEGGHGTYIFFVIAGIVFLSIAIFHHPLKRRFPLVDTCFFSIEALLSFVIAYDYFHMNKTGLPFMYLLAGILQLSAVFIFSKKLKNSQL